MQGNNSDLDEVLALKLTLEQSIGSIKEVLSEISENAEITPSIIRTLIKFYLEDLFNISKTEKISEDPTESLETEFPSQPVLPKPRNNLPSPQSFLMNPITTDLKHQQRFKTIDQNPLNHGKFYIKKNPLKSNNPLELEQNQSLFQPSFNTSSPMGSLFQPSFNTNSQMGLFSPFFHQQSEMARYLVDSKPVPIDYAPKIKSKAKSIKNSAPNVANFIFNKPAEEKRPELPKKRFRDFSSEINSHGNDKPENFHQKNDKNSETRKGFSSDELKNLSFIRYSHENFKTKEECDLCLEEYVENVKITFLNCFHKFHTNCLKECLKKKNECPVCLSEVFLE